VIGLPTRRSRMPISALAAAALLVAACAGWSTAPTPSTNGLADLYVVNGDGTDLHVFARTRLRNESHANWGIDPLP
jgi:hypothetical protein